MKISVRSFLGAPIFFQKQRVGRVKGIFFDPDTGKFMAIQVSEQGFFASVNCQFHSDFLEIFSRERSKKMGKNLLGFSVVGISGERLGRVADLFCDASSGHIQEILTEKKVFFVLVSRKIFSAEKILRIRGTNIIIDDDARSKEIRTKLTPLLFP